MAGTSETIELEPHGDLYLMVGQPPTLRLRVSASKLSKLSPVFERMLCGHFSEGQIKRSEQQPQTVELLEDNHKAIWTIGHMLYRSDMVNTVLDAEELYNLVEACDKYDCIPTLRLQLHSLAVTHFAALGRPLTMTNSALRIGAAYLLNDYCLFAKATKHIIEHSNAPVSDLRNMRGGQVLGAAALLALAERRATAQRKVSHEVSAQDPRRVGCTCPSDEDTVYESEMGDLYDIWPPCFEDCDLTLSSVLDRLKAIKSFSIYKHCCGVVVDQVVDIRGIADEVNQSCKGLCLRCVREDSGEPYALECRHEN